MLLPWLILVPFFGGILCLKAEIINKKFPRYISVICLIIEFLLLLILIKKFMLVSKENLELINWKYKFFANWIPRFGISLYFSIDGLSLIMIILSCILSIIAVLSSWEETKKNCGFFYFNLMFILSSVIGIFLSMDMILFFFFWELILLPMYFLISLWGHKEYSQNSIVKTANKFFIYNQIGGAVMLVSILSLSYMHYYQYGFLTFNYELLQNLNMPYYIEYFLMLGFFISFAIKLPVIGLHGWLADFHAKTPNTGAVDLLGILIKTSIYGLLRFNINFFPKTSADFSYIAILLGIINIFYFSFISYRQNDIKRLVAYSSMSHMGFVLIAIYSRNISSLQGVIIHSISYSLSSSALFILCGQIFKRLKTRNMNNIPLILWDKIKWLPGILMFFSLANLGLPGTGNFIGEFIILNSSFSSYPKIIFITTLSLIFSSIYSLNMVQKTCYLNTNNKKQSFINEMNLHEILIMFILAFLIIILGFFPQIVLNISYPTITNTNKLFIR